MIFIALILIFYLLPNVIIDFLQIKKIKEYANKPAIILNENDYKTSAAYQISTLKLNIIENIFSFCVLCVWVLFGLNYLQNLFDNSLLESIFFIISFFIINYLISLPFNIIQTFKIDKKFGFSTITPKLFITDLLQNLVLSAVFGFVILWALLFVMKFDYWYLYGFVILFSFIIILNIIYLPLIAPLFNTFTPLENKELETKIQDLLTKAGFKASSIMVMDAKRRDNRLNAFFGGIGKSKKIVLFDTLLEKVSQPGLLAVLGHELGHFKHKDIIGNILVSGIVIFILFLIAGNLPLSLFQELGLEKTNASTLIALILIAPFIIFWIQPIISFNSRKNEYRADRYGASLTSASCLKEALIRLVNENKSFPYSHPAYIFFHYSHPPLLERLSALDCYDDKTSAR